MKVKKAIIYTFFMIFVLKINTVIILGDTIEAYKPLSNIVDISCDSHGMALKDNGTITVWGKNSYGQLGDGTKVNKNSPIKVKSISEIKDITGGGYYSLVLKNDGTVWAWGFNGMSGHLGNNSTDSSLTSVQVSGLENVIAIDSYISYSLALKDDGTVWAWGDNPKYVLGIESDYSRIPVKVSNLADIRAIAAGGSCLALKGDGTVWTWGGDPYDKSSRFPVKINDLSDVQAIDSSGTIKIALKKDGTVWTWGGNDFGQFGNGKKYYSDVLSITPAQVKNLSDVVAISAGYSHVLALKQDGTVWAWGNNEYGQLGDGSLEERLTPVQVSNLSDIKTIDSGYSVSMALKNDGTVWTWGLNSLGQLGDGTTENKSIPIQVKALTSITSPSYPINVQVTAGVSKVNLSWDSVPEADSYTIKRSTSSGSNFTTIATDINTTTYEDTGLTNGTTYYYVVIAKNAAGESENSGEVSATPLQLAPSSPKDLFAENRNQSVKLTWSEAEGATAYKVKRGTVSGGPYTVVVDNVTDIMYMDTGLTNEVDYYYVVSAVNAEGESADSNEVVGRPLGDTNGLFRVGARGLAPVRNLLPNWEDTNTNGIADGWTTALSSTVAFNNGIQSFTPTAQFGSIIYKFPDDDFKEGDYVYFAMDCKTVATGVQIYVNDGVSQTGNLIANDGNWHRKSVVRQITTNPLRSLVKIQDNSSSGWSEIQVKNPVVFKIPSIDKTYFDSIGYVEGFATSAQSYDLVSRGKNKFDVDKAYDIKASHGNMIDGETLRIYSNRFHTSGALYELELEPNTQYTFKNRFIFGGNANVNYSKIYEATSGITLKQFNTTVSPQQYTFTTPSDGLIRIEFARTGGGSDLLGWMDITDIQLEKGTTATEYEPYTSDKTEFSVPRPMIRIGGVYDEVTTGGNLIYRNSDKISSTSSDTYVDYTNNRITRIFTWTNITDAKAYTTNDFDTTYLFDNTSGAIVKQSLYNDKDLVSNQGMYVVNDNGVWLISAVGITPTINHSLNYQLAQHETIEKSQQGYKAPSPIQAYPNGDLIQYATSIKQVKLTNTNTILMDEKCIEIVELESNGTKLSGQLGSNGKTITLDNNHTGIVYAKCKRDPSTYLDVQLVAVKTPSNVEAIPKDQAVTLSWNYIEGVDNYTVLRSTSPEDNYTTIASNITSSVYNDTGLTNGTTYYYKILANKDGESGSSSVISATPQGIPSIPTGLAVENGYKSVKLTWEKSNAASTYRIKRSTISGGPYTQIADQVTNTTYTDTNLINGTNYYYVILAVNTTGESADSNEITGQPTIVKPNTPINIDVLVGDKVVTLTWHDMINAESYIIKRSTTKGGPYTLVADQITTNTYTDANLSNATPYYYIIIAKNSVGESQPSNEIEAIAGVQRPTNVIIQKVDTGIRLSWNLVNDASSYKVKRSETLEGPYTVIQDNITGTDYIDTTIQNNKIYYYVLSATNYLGESPDTKPISVYVQDDSKERYILLITLINGMQKEYDISADTAVEFMQWYTNRANGIGTPFFTLFNEEKEVVYGNSKDYIGFGTILYYQLNEYEIKIVD